MAERKLRIIVTDAIKFGCEERLGQIMRERFIPALRKQLPGFKWTVYRPVIGGKLGLMILVASGVTAEQIVNFDEWIVSALEREHGKAEASRYLKDWYDGLHSSEYMVVVEDPDWSNQ